MGRREPHARRILAVALVGAPGAASSAGAAPGRMRTTVPARTGGSGPASGAMTASARRMRSVWAPPTAGRTSPPRTASPTLKPAARQLDAHARRLRDRALERRRVGGRARLVVEHDRGLARLLVFFLAHQRDAPARARTPVDVARIVAVPVGAQPAELALTAGRERSPRRRVGRQPAHQRLRRRAATPGRRTARPRRRSRARAAGARRGTSSPAGSPTGGSARAAPSCCGTPSLARDPRAASGSSSASRSAGHRSDPRPRSKTTAGAASGSRARSPSSRAFPRGRPAAARAARAGRRGRAPTARHRPRAGRPSSRTSGSRG